ncbi:VOC family protein [Desulfopila sp. IMCC35008]|uniref:VOC family protein n=1 Tax=Desulfopila sp. IMCC35008 TaxID=2653858 RepID=UPI0013D62869|nr:VOC family protein [Desulfopila sp. IMCC35008]
MNKEAIINKLDHLVIAAKSLEQGVAYVEETLGVTIPFGGIHPQMGTHNHLASLGTDSFLEIIAINPNAEPPRRPRWFDLDNPLMIKSLQRSPRLIGWVANTNNIKEVLAHSRCSFGTPETLQRDHLSWQFGLPADGRLLAGGFLPYLIQWPSKTHPAADMYDVGLHLKSLTCHHTNPAWLKSMLSSIGADGLIRIKQASCSKSSTLSAQFKTPSGEVTLHSLEQ